MPATCRPRILPGSARVSFRNTGAARQRVTGNREHVELVLALERDVDPGLCRVEIEMARPEAVAAVRRDRNLIGQQAVPVMRRP